MKEQLCTDLHLGDGYIIAEFYSITRKLVNSIKFCILLPSAAQARLREHTLTQSNAN